jgi:hypothetical protein
MKLVRNIGTDRVIDLVRPLIKPGSQFDVVTPSVSLFAFAEVLPQAAALARCRFLLPPGNAELALFGADADRPARNRLQTRWLAKRLLRWLDEKADVRRGPGPVPQGAFVMRDAEAQPIQSLLGSLSFSTDGLGLMPGACSPPPSPPSWAGARSAPWPACSRPAARTP